MVDEKNLEDLLNSKYIHEPVKGSSVTERVINYLKNLYFTLVPKKRKPIGYKTTFNAAKNYRGFIYEEISWEELREANQCIEHEPIHADEMAIAEYETSKEKNWVVNED